MASAALELVNHGRGPANQMAAQHLVAGARDAAQSLLAPSGMVFGCQSDEGCKIPSRTVGKYRRVRFDDLMAFKRKDDDARAKVLDQLSAEAQELGMGY